MIWIFFIGLVSCVRSDFEQRLPDDFINSDNNSDDDEINQALQLVDILKSEYAKLLRERSKVLETTAVVEQSTCALTATIAGDVAANPTPTLTQNGNNEPLASRSHIEYLNITQTPAMEESNPSVAPLPWRAAIVPVGDARPEPSLGMGTTSSYHSSTMPIYDMARSRRQPYPLYRRRLHYSPQMPRRYWRRFFPDYIDVPPRRFYRDPASTNIRPGTPGARSTTPARPAAFSTKNPARTTVRSSTAFRKTAASSVRSTSNSQLLTKPPRTTKKHVFHKKTANKLLHSNSLTKIKDPVEAEVALELFKEFRQMNITLKAKTIEKTSEDSTSTEV